MRLLMAAILITGLPAVLWAAPNENARFALHIHAPLPLDPEPPFCGPGSPSPNEEGLPCSAYTVTRSQLREWPGPVVYVMVGHADSVGISDVELGIDYTGGTGTGIDPQWVTWTACTDGLEFRNSGFNGDWPAPGGGIRVTWTTCQNQVIGDEGVHVVIGALGVYVYSAAVLELTPDYQGEPTGRLLYVRTCDGETTDLEQLFPWDPSILPRVQFGGSGQAWNPCLGTVPVRSTTWGRIKRQYRP